MSTRLESPSPEKEKLLARLREDFFNLKPASDFHKEILAAMRDSPPERVADDIRLIMDKHGYDKLDAADIRALIAYKPESEVKLPGPINPPVTRVIDPQTAPFSIRAFCAIYEVKSENPPCLEIGIKDEGDGVGPQIEYISTSELPSIRYPLTLELEPKTSEYWVSWTTPDKIVWKIRLYTQYENGRVIKHFQGTGARADGTPSMSLIGEEKIIPVEDPDREPGWWSRNGVYVVLGTIGVVYAIVSYYHKRGKKLKDQLMADEGARLGKKAMAEQKALGDAEAVERFLESISQPRREQLLIDIKQGIQAEFNNMVLGDDIPKERFENGDLNFDFDGEDRARRQRFDEIVRNKITLWVEMNPNIPISEINQKLVDTGFLSQAELKNTETTVRTEATRKLKGTFTSDYGNYRNLVDNALETIRVTFNADTLNHNVANFQSRMDSADASFDKLEEGLKDLKRKLNEAQQGIEQERKGGFEEYKWQKMEKEVLLEIDARVKEQKEETEKKKDAKERYDASKNRQGLVETEKRNFEEARVNMEKGFKKRIMIGF